jgi:hypothetical protein
MAKNISSIRDLIILANNNISDIKTKAKDGDPEACFQIGMIHLLGIKTPIDFKKASSFLENQSLADDPDACRLLGFIGECESDYSAAFKNYANAAGSKSKLPYLNKVFEERNNLQGFFKKLVLPNAMFNKEITAIINDYIKGGESKVDASIKLATLCNDEITCLEAAHSLYDVGDLYSAKRWLQMGNVANTNELFITINNKLSDSKKSFKLPDVLQVIDIEGNAFLANSNSYSSIAGVKPICDDVAVKCKKTWMEEIPLLTSKIKARLDEEEKERKRQQKEEEAALKKKQKDEEAARKKKQKDEETARLRRQEEEQQEIRRNKIYRRYNIIYAIISSPFILLLLLFLLTDKHNSFMVNLSVCIISFAIFVVLPYVIIKWIIRKICKLG